MQILIVRHAIAEQRELFAARNPNDDLRPLTSKGIERMRRGCSGLKRVLPQLDLILTSPLARAVQTGDILAQSYPDAGREVLPELSPGCDPQLLVEQFADLPSDHRLALVGHEPDLSDLVSWLCCGNHFGFMHLKKGSACLLECSGRPGPASAQMHWMMTPRQLRNQA